MVSAADNGAARRSSASQSLPCALVVSGASGQYVLVEMRISFGGTKRIALWRCSWLYQRVQLAAQRWRRKVGLVDAHFMLGHGSSGCVGSTEPLRTERRNAKSAATSKARNARSRS
jgi:hypothetical protein